MTFRVGCSLACAAAVACTDGAAVGSRSHTTVDSAGVEIVESTAPAWAPGSRRIDPEPFLRIGREEEGPYQFGFVPLGLLLDDGSLAIGEITTQEVRIFDAGGNHVATLGGTGAGPGEIRNMSGLFAYQGDSLAVSDGRLGRTTIFSRTSGAYRTVVHRVEGNYGVFGVLQGGTFLMLSRGGSYRPDLDPGLQWTPTDIVAVDAADGSTRVIARLPMRQQVVEPDGNTALLIPQQWAVQGVAPDGFYWTTSDRYEIRFYDPEGVLRRIQRTPVAPDPVEPSMIEEYVEGVLEDVRGFEGEDAIPRYREQYEQAIHGERVPLFGKAFVDEDGRFWISRAVWPAFRDPPRDWDVFSEEGVWLGTLGAPEGVDVLDARGDVILGIWRDDLDVPHVQLHRVVGG